MNEGDALKMLLAVAQLATPVLVAVAGWLVKRAIGDMDRRIAHTERCVANLQAQALVVAENKADEHALIRLAESAVTKEDFLRETGRFCQKLDEMAKRMSTHEGQDQAIRDLATTIASALLRSERHES